MATFTTLGANTAASKGADVTSGLNAKGSWVEFSASLASDMKILYLFWNVEDASDFLIDIGTGSAGSEAVIIPDLVIDSPVVGASGMLGPIRTNLAAGERLSVRAESNSTVGGNEIVSVVLILCDEVTPELTSYTYATYGAIAGADTKATPADPGGVAHTKGAYTELTAAAQANIEQVTLIFGSNNNTAQTTATWLVDVAIGSAGSETNVIENIFISTLTTSDHPLPDSFSIPGDQFGGQRISFRAQCSITDAADRLITLTTLTAAGTPVAAGSGGASQLVNSQALVG